MSGLQMTSMCYETIDIHSSLNHEFMQKDNQDECHNNMKQRDNKNQIFKVGYYESCQYPK